MQLTYINTLFKAKCIYSTKDTHYDKRYPPADEVVEDKGLFADKVTWLQFAWRSQHQDGHECEQVWPQKRWKCPKNSKNRLSPTLRTFCTYVCPVNVCQRCVLQVDIVVAYSPYMRYSYNDIGGRDAHENKSSRVLHSSSFFMKCICSLFFIIDFLSFSKWRCFCPLNSRRGAHRLITIIAISFPFAIWHKNDCQCSKDWERWCNHDNRFHGRNKFISVYKTLGAVTSKGNWTRCNGGTDSVHDLCWLECKTNFLVFSAWIKWIITQIT